MKVVGLLNLRNRKYPKVYSRFLQGANKASLYEISIISFQSSIEYVIIVKRYDGASRDSGTQPSCGISILLQQALSRAINYCYHCSDT